MITTKQRREWGRLGGLKRAQQFTAESQRAARACVKTESLQAAGAAGFKAFCQKHGPEAAAKRFADWRREHPSILERIVRGWLDEWNVFYLSEAVVEGCTVYPDFLILGLGLVVECDGRGWHAMRSEYDSWRDELLRAQGYTVLRLAESAIRDGSAREILERHLGGAA